MEGGGWRVEGGGWRVETAYASFDMGPREAPVRPTKKVLVQRHEHRVEQK